MIYRARVPPIALGPFDRYQTVTKYLPFELAPVPVLCLYVVNGETPRWNGTETMNATDTRSNAERYADQLAEMIIDNHSNGHVFGLNDDGEDIDAWEYLDGVLDIEYRVRARLGGGLDYVGARILIGFGGPNVWIDTKDRELIVTWYSAPEVRELPVDFCDYLDSALSELFDDHMAR